MIDAEVHIKKTDGFVIVMEILVALILLLGGALLGEQLTKYVAPNQGSLHLLGLIMLPLSFVLGLQIWLGLAFARAIWVGATQKADHPFQWRRPKGIGILLPVSLVICGSVGAVVASLNHQAFAKTLLLYLGIGLLHGCLCWFLGSLGCFDFWKWIGGEQD